MYFHNFNRKGNQKLTTKEDAVMQWKIQVGNPNTDIEVKIDSTLPEFSMTIIAKWECHMDESAIGRYNVILGRDLIIRLVLNINCFENVIEADYVPLKGSTATTIVLGK